MLPPFIIRMVTIMDKIISLSIDLETFSDVDLKKCGTYKYTESPNFEILLFAYSIDGGEVIVIDLANGEEIPIEVLSALSDESVTKWAFNAAFERICLSAWLRKNYPEYFSSYSNSVDTVGNYLNPSSWKCSMIWSAYIGLPLSLEGVGAVLGLQEQKMKEGKDLIRYFCVPCKPTKLNGGRTRNLPMHDIAKWAAFVSYNRRDVEVEMSIQKKLAKFPVPEFVWEEYHIDQKINDRGIAIDIDVVEHAIKMDERSKEVLSEEMKKLTNLDNPNSVVQMKQWLCDNGVETDTLGKKAVLEMLKDAPQKLADVLTLRQQLAKSSIKKYQAMQNAVCADSRARGMFQFYGANRSGRWAGRLIQLQNLPQNHMPDLEQARDLVKSGNYDALKMLYNSVPEVLSELIRTAFIPKPGYKFAVLDYSAIEARVLSHLAQESWRNKVFANNGDIYCASASAMFGVLVEKHGQNSHLRQKGKIAELALGYGGSCGALKSMGALDMGLAEEELQPLVDAWRTSNPSIVQFWWDVDKAVKIAIKQKITTETHSIYFIYQSGMLFIKLPSGRKLTYVKPKIGMSQFGGESVTYEGIGATKKWERIESYGPKFVENIVQAISRDILSYAMRTLSHYFICGHVHDELIIECPIDESFDVICEQMGITPPWMKGLQLRADGYETMFYKKD
jgi:DNA polymerase bacteriophage-type